MVRLRILWVCVGLHYFALFFFRPVLLWLAFTVWWRHIVCFLDMVDVDLLKYHLVVVHLRYLLSYFKTATCSTSVLINTTAILYRLYDRLPLWKTRSAVVSGVHRLYLMRHNGS